MTPARQFQFWLVAVIVVLVFLYLLRAILLPFVAGIGIAYLLDPSADWLQRRKLSRTWATSLITFGSLLFLVGAILIVVPVVQAQIIGFIGRMPAYAEALRTGLENAVALVSTQLDAGELDQIRAVAGAYAGRAMDWILGVFGDLWSGGVAFLNLVSLLFITPIVTFYLLRDWDHITAHVDGWLPRDHAEEIRGLASDIDLRLAGFVRGQLMVAAILGGAYALALSILGLEFGLMIGLGAGVVSLVPFVGAIAGFVVAITVALFQFSGDWWMIGLVGFVFVAGQALEGNFLTPRLVGARIGLHPVWVIFAVLAGGVLFGFVGVLLAVPAAAVIGVLVRYALVSYQQSRLFLGSGGNG